jgi:hypothetical protein
MVWSQIRLFGKRPRYFQGFVKNDPTSRDTGLLMSKHIGYMIIGTTDYRDSNLALQRLTTTKGVWLDLAICTLSSCQAIRGAECVCGET